MASITCSAHCTGPHSILLNDLYPPRRMRYRGSRYTPYWSDVLMNNTRYSDDPLSSVAQWTVNNLPSARSDQTKQISCCINYWYSALHGRDMYSSHVCRDVYSSYGRNWPQRQGAWWATRKPWVRFPQETLLFRRNGSEGRPNLGVRRPEPEDKHAPPLVLISSRRCS